MTFNTIIMKQHKHISNKNSRVIKTKTIWFLIFLFPWFTLSGQFSYPKSITHSFNNDTYDFGDFDNDGDLDVVLGGYDYNRTLAWFENLDGGGIQWMPHSIPQSQLGNTIRDVKTVDIDNDGDMDFFASGNRTNKLYLFRNNSTSTEVVFTQEVIKEDINCIFLEVADFDNNPITVELLAGNTDGFIRFSFDPNQGLIAEDTLNTSNYSLFTYVTPSVQIIDIDADGDQDILLGRNFITQTIAGIEYYDLSFGWLENIDNQLDFSVYHSIDDRSFVSEIELGCQYISCYMDIIAGDVNGDNLPDVIYYTGENSNFGLKVLPQNPDHTFANGEFINSQFGSEIISLDIDEDGDLDIFTNDKGEEKYWYQNDGNGNFIEMIVNTIERNEKRGSIAMGDVDNDGDEDLFYHSSNGGSVNNNQPNITGLLVIKNEGNANFSEANYITDNLSLIYSKGVFTHDFDGDSDDDLMILSSGEGKIYWVENESGDSLSQPKIIIDEDNIIAALPPIDLDNDNDADIVAFTRDNELIWFASQGAPPNFSTKNIIDADIPVVGLRIYTGDIDADGDLDILADSSSNFVVYKNFGNGTFASPENIPISNIQEIVAITDINLDGIPDILFRKTSFNPNVWGAIQDGNGNFTEIMISNNSNYTLRSAIVNDIDDDGDVDIVTVIDNNLCPSPVCSKIVVYFQDGGIYNEVVVAEMELNYTYFMRGIADLDGDGRKDIYGDDTWHRQLSSPNIFSNALSHVPNYYNHTFIYNTARGHGDFDNDGDNDLYFRYSWNGLFWIENQVSEGKWVSGNVYWDENENCANDGIDTLINLQLILAFENTDTTYYASTNTQGFYNILLPDTGEYNITITTPSTYWESCLNDSLIQIDSSLTLDIPILNSVDCPLIGIHVSSTPFRPCIDGVVGVWYNNNGTTTANDVQIEVVPDQHLIIDSISLPWTTMTDTSYIFDIGDVGYTDEGSLYFYVTPDCDSITFGDLICINAYVTPDSICNDSLWDGSVISAIGECAGDSVSFTLENVGTGDMEIARDYSVNIVNDDIVMLIFLDTFLLNAGQTKVFTLPNQNNVLQLVAEQDPNLPNGDDVSILVTGCSGLPINEVQHLITNFPDNDGDPFTERYCREITGAYDPNSKEAIPEGYSDENFIDRTWEINYTLNFQNVGNDTAFTVIIIDSLTEHLDISTLKVQGGSHPFTWQLEADRNLVFTFNNINLPDSLTNEAGSQGYVNLSIKPKSEVEFGTQIINKAAIYFDFNEPIITNSFIHTIRTPIFSNSTHLELCEGDNSFGFPLLTDTLVIDSMMTSDGLYLSFQHLEVIPTLVTEVDTMIEIGEVFLNFIIQQDTIIEQILLDANNCDSIVLYNISILPTSIENLKPSNVFKVFPNPTEDKFSVTWEDRNQTPNQIDVFDNNGILYHRFSSNFLENNSDSQQHTFEIANWKSGIYILKISNKSVIYYQRIIVLNNGE